MISFLFTGSLLLLGLTASGIAQSNTGDGYIGYSLQQRGNPDSVVYETANTPSNASDATLPPDVYLNASLHVGEISLDVQNLTAQINLKAEVLSLLQFNAGVDVSVDRVSLLIQNVTAKVLLEARLENLVRMIDDVLSSVDLNPVLATLGNDVGQIVNTTTGAVTGSSSALAARGLPYDLENNILYSMNDYQGNMHTNRILAQNGSIIQQGLNNGGHIYSQDVVGNFSRDMSFNGYNVSTSVDGKAARELEYIYTPLPGLTVISAIYVDAAGLVLRTQVLAESSAGGSSTISGELKG